MNHSHEQHEEDSVELIEDALVMGKLMEVDWAKRTARLDRFRQKSVKLRFGQGSSTRRCAASQPNIVQGRGQAAIMRAPDTDE